VVTRESASPSVTAVVPTVGRPGLVPRAIASALGQTLPDVDVVAVVDGPDEATLATLRAIGDGRLRVLALPRRLGVGNARNAGVDAARGRWTALLDDDDEWLPRKLEQQLAVAERSRHPAPIVSCRFQARTEEGDVVLPRRVPRPGEPLSEYLFCQTSVLGGEGAVLPSTIFAPTDILRRTRFRHRSLPHEGSDWLLRAVRHDGVGVEFVEGSEPLAIWNGERRRERMSNALDWRTSLDWAAANRDLLTPRSYAAFLLIRASLEARRARDWRASARLVRESFRGGAPTATGLLAHALIWLVPPRLRFAAAALATRLVGDASGMPG
jgi:glycosyltransferase involved in cell wall biosynthesis